MSRRLLTLAIPFALGVVIIGHYNHELWSLFSSLRTPGARGRLGDALRNLNIPAKPLLISYASNTTPTHLYDRLDYRHPTGQIPDTTAIVLNWSRFQNVALIAGLLCGPWLDHTIAEVFVWNNSPHPISFEDFLGSGCSRKKLKIYNSPSNILFQARFLACSQANTPYCFIQDDDYLIRPEVIDSLHHRFVEFANHRPIHLLPAHEHLSSVLREVHSPDYAMHTSFAWLGHGAFLHQSRATEFLALMGWLNCTEEELSMADNYFTILSNQVPEIWVDQGIELGGGQPFTIGTEGDIRNRKHIEKAAQHLDFLISESTRQISEIPYFSTEDDYSNIPISRTPCVGASCVLETNIQLLPDGMSHVSHSAANILAIEEENAHLLGEDGQRHYIGHPAAHAVDGKPDTNFTSPSSAQKGEWIMIDALQSLGSKWMAVEMVWLVDHWMEVILRGCNFESSADRENWTATPHVLSCQDAVVETGKGFIECSMQIPVDGNGHQYFRAILNHDIARPWRISEVWLRGRGL
ncbi:hypothetical protein JAAARDRAFT_202624 [Jaapia argillacea MUCL 33604]|uniref:Uncharacterized protein n=1 Tax=Jaapia argillacea MUCL 33604 TaxID=933084 RepID=A0A067QAB4_9AGAM|nr:hypothetical protein JAAARDRAFT_202624 [Jaapia argillacea MUCL 33604]